MTIYIGRCINGQGYRSNHDAEGWLCEPEGRRNTPKCREHAQETIDEYATKLGEQWSFEQAEEDEEDT